MKKIVFFTILLLLVAFSYAQFGGGTGTIIDPYKIYSRSHLEELHDGLISGNSFTNIYFELMNDINDSLRLPLGKDDAPFNGHFHGNGHNIVLAIDLRDSIQYSNMGEYCLFPKLDTNSYLDSLSITGYIFAGTGFVGDNYGVIVNLTNNLSVPYNQNEFSQYVESMGGDIEGAGICSKNYGTIKNCTNYCEIHGNFLGGICCTNIGVIQNCINKGILTIYNISDYSCSGGGICSDNIPLEGGIDTCKNYADIVFLGNLNVFCIGGIVGSNCSKIINSSNFGNISGKVYTLGGCIGTSQGGEILNCSNHGNISGGLAIGGIGGFGEFDIVQNCFNSGNISGDSLVGGIFAYTSASDTISRCLNIGRTNGAAVVDFLYQSAIQPAVLFFNYYDKQMCISKGINGEDILGSAEGKLTPQLTGTSAELQTMLGDGWSYADGRYPIPLGLENDSMALVAATPIYLYAENESNYNHVDSVTKNFTVGMENSVSWAEIIGRVNIENENVTLLNVGVEKLVVSLGEYEKEVRINIEDTEVANPQAIISDDISVYPNPASGSLNLNINGNNASEIEIYDITGNLLMTKSLHTARTHINIESFTSGLYILKIKNNNQCVGTLKFSKK